MNGVARYVLAKFEVIMVIGISDKVGIVKNLGSSSNRPLMRNRVHIVGSLEPLEDPVWGFK